jgi:hypothetical protein
MPCACSKLIIPPSANPLAWCLIMHYYWSIRLQESSIGTISNVSLE